MENTKQLLTQLSTASFMTVSLRLYTEHVYHDNNFFSILHV